MISRQITAQSLSSRCSTSRFRARLARSPNEEARSLGRAFRYRGVHLQCGAKDNPRYRVEVRNINIVDARRVVWTETIRDPDKLLATNITTFEFMPYGQRTRLKVTVQVTSFAGVSMIQNTKTGQEGSPGKQTLAVHQEYDRRVQRTGPLATSGRSCVAA